MWQYWHQCRFFPSNTSKIARRGCSDPKLNAQFTPIRLFYNPISFVSLVCAKTFRLRECENVARETVASISRPRRMEGTENVSEREKNGQFKQFAKMRTVEKSNNDIDYLNVLAFTPKEPCLLPARRTMNDNAMWREVLRNWGRQGSGKEVVR